MSQRTDYIALYKQMAVDSTTGTGLFPSVMLAQAIVESGDGKSLLAKKYNNHFGIKADKSWTGKAVDMNTREVINGSTSYPVGAFRVYDDPKQSYIDRVAFLKNNPRYEKAGVFTASTPLEQLQRLQKAGYATDPNYATIIDQVLEHDNLGALDKAIGYTVAFTKKNWIPITITTVGLIGMIFTYKNATK